MGRCLASILAALLVCVLDATGRRRTAGCHAAIRSCGLNTP